MVLSIKFIEIKVKSMIQQINSAQSITEAAKKLKAGDILLLEDGIYHEKVEIWTSGITIRAKNQHQAILTNQDYYHKIMPNHNECNTFGTYTLLIGGHHITLQDLIIQNEATPSAIYGQAVALHVIGNDFSCFQCIIKGAQDTLFAGPMPQDLLQRYQSFYEPRKLTGLPSAQYYKQCQILGDVDYIFGCATALFEDCDLISLRQPENKISYISAPAHSQEMPYGFLFYHCHLKGSSPTYLARPWRDYGCAAFINCQMDSHILPKGFHKWNDSHRDQTARFYEYTPDCKTTNREPWSHQLNLEEANDYVTKFKKYYQQLIQSN